MGGTGFQTETGAGAATGVGAIGTGPTGGGAAPPTGGAEVTLVIIDVLDPLLRCYRRSVRTFLQLEA